MSATPKKLRDWADNPAASGMVPVSPKTLRFLADEIDSLRQDADRYRMIKTKRWMEPGLEPTIDAAIAQAVQP